MAAKHHSLWKPARVEYAPGVVKVEEHREDVYIGDAESLIAAGLARRDEFPGQPGQGATMATYDKAGNPIPQGSNYINGLKWAGRRRISRRGAARFSVGIGVDDDEHEVRRKAWLEAERGSKSNVVPIIRSRGGSPGEGSRVQPSVIEGALPPPSAPAPVARRERRRAPSRPMVAQPDAHTPTARTLAFLADAGAVLRLLAASVGGAPLDQDGCQRLQGAARTALHLLLEALALADEHTDDDQAPDDDLRRCGRGRRDPGGLLRGGGTKRRRPARIPGGGRRSRLRAPGCPAGGQGGRAAGRKLSACLTPTQRHQPDDGLRGPTVARSDGRPWRSPPTPLQSPKRAPGDLECRFLYRGPHLPATSQRRLSTSSA